MKVCGGCRTVTAVPASAAATYPAAASPCGRRTRGIGRFAVEACRHGRTRPFTGGRRPPTSCLSGERFFSTLQDDQLFCTYWIREFPSKGRSSGFPCFMHVPVGKRRVKLRPTGTSTATGGGSTAGGRPQGSPRHKHPSILRIC